MKRHILRTSAVVIFAALGFGQQPTSIPAPNLVTVAVALSNAQIITLFSAPLLVIPAPAAGSLIHVVGWTLESNANGTAYTGGGAISLFYGSTSPPPNPASSLIGGALLTTGAFANIGVIQGGTGGFTTDPTIGTVGTGVYLANQSANFAQVGNLGTAKLEVQYYVSAGW